jgi:hypothetical protein
LPGRKVHGLGIFWFVGHAGFLKMISLGELIFVRAEKMAFVFSEAQHAGQAEQSVGVIFECTVGEDVLDGDAAGYEVTGDQNSAVAGMDGVADGEYGGRHVGQGGGSRKMAATTL